MESIESLLSRELQGGFRGVQSKAWSISSNWNVSPKVRRCSRSSTARPRKIWIQDGEVTDAEAPGLPPSRRFNAFFPGRPGASKSFRRTEPHADDFHILPGPALNTAQALDEAASLEMMPSLDYADVAAEPGPARIAPLLAELSQMSGIEFVLAIGPDRNAAHDFWDWKIRSRSPSSRARRWKSFENWASACKPASFSRWSAPGRCAKSRSRRAARRNCAWAFPRAWPQRRCGTP